MSDDRIELTFFERVGGHEVFKEMVRQFYIQVESDPILMPMYPKKDLVGAAQRLTLFLEQYWGGPTTYSDTRGHPRLRMRHAGFHIATLQKEAWLKCMHAAIIGLTIEEELKAELWTYFQFAAQSMVNQPDQVTNL